MPGQTSGGTKGGVKERRPGGGRAGSSNARSVADVMTRDPMTVSSDSTVIDAARMMRELDIGVVLVQDGNQVRGVVTDRDITIRAVAEERDPATTPVTEVATLTLTTVSPADSLERAAEIMRTEAVRRLIVIEGGRPAGIISLGDLAQTDEAADDAGIALSDISAADPDQ